MSVGLVDHRTETTEGHATNYFLNMKEMNIQADHAERQSCC